MAYRLYLDSIHDIERYNNFLKMNKEKQQRELYFYNVCNPLKFNINGKNKDSFKIEEIDSLLCCYRNEEELIKEIKKHNISYLTNKEQNTNYLNLVYKNQGKIIKAPIIYDDLLLFEQAINLRNKKRNCRKGQKVFTDSTERLEDFIIYIKSLVINPTTRDFLLNPKNIEYLTLEEKAYLDMDVLKGQTKYDIGDYGENRKRVVRPGVRPLLKDFLRFSDIFEDNSKNEQSSIDIENDLREIEKEISLFFRTDYRNLRKMIEWENRYVKVLEQVLERKNISEERRDIIKLQIEKVKLEKECRNNRAVRKLSQYEDETEKYELFSFKNEECSNYFENDRIKELYQSGGIEELMESMDLDEILSNPEDAQKLGIIPKNK